MNLCADIGGTFVTVALVEGGERVVDRQRRQTPTNDWDAFVEVLLASQAHFASRLSSAAALSISLSGFIDPATGVTASANVRCVGGRPLARDLAAALGRPVVVTNDADCFTLAEARLGAGRGHARVFGLILGTGVGGGLVQDGRLLTGEGGVSGEWGHGAIITRPRGDPAAAPYFRCGCGQWGCLDTVGAARGLERLHAWLYGAAADSREITGRWEDGEPAATQTIALYLELVCGPLAMLLNTWAATIVPVGGGLSASAQLIGALDAGVRARMLRTPSAPLLAPASLGADAGLLGAALAAER